MSRVATKILFDKDIQALQPKEKQYRLVVGNPKELILFVYPSGVKTFALRILGSGGSEKCIKLSQFRAGIYSVADARKEAASNLKRLYKHYSKRKIQKSYLNDLANRLIPLLERAREKDEQDYHYRYLAGTMEYILHNFHKTKIKRDSTMNKSKGLIKNSTDRESKHTKDKGANNERD